MRAAVLRGAAGDGRLAVERVPVPDPSVGEARVRVLRTGICGSDLHFVLDGTARTAYTPIILGHESVGVVDELGPATAGPAPGTRVAIVPLVTCVACARCAAGRTVLCRDRACLGCDVEGTYAEFATVPVRNLVPVPAGLPDELAAVATDSVATALHAVERRGLVGHGRRVAVFGTGGLGLSAVGIARTLEAASIIAVDPRAEARAWALETGADQAVHPDDAADVIRRAGGVDTAMEFVGRASTCEAAVRSLDDGGRAVIVGVGHEQAQAGRLMTFVLREREMVGSYGSEPQDVARVLDLLASGALRLPRAIGDVVALGDITEAMERVAAGRAGGSRIVVDVTR